MSITKRTIRDLGKLIFLGICVDKKYKMTYAGIIKTDQGFWKPCLMSIEMI